MSSKRVGWWAVVMTIGFSRGYQINRIKKVVKGHYIEIIARSDTPGLENIL